MKDSSGGGNEEVLFESADSKRPTSWSSDGRFIAYTSTVGPGGRGDIWVLPLSGERRPFPLLQTPFDKNHAQFSPDGSFIAYDSDEAGSRQVYVASFPGPGGKRQVSTGGGREPIWRGDGKELFFLAEGKLMAAGVNAKGSNLDIGNPQLLFDAHLALPGAANMAVRRDYDVAPDGKRFLILTAGEESSAPINLVVNWTADLKR